MEPMAEVEVGGAKAKVAIHAIVDTGFSGQLCIPVELAVRLGLELAAQDVVELADGTRNEQLFFKGSARLLGKTKKVRIFLTRSEDSLIGTELLTGCRLLIDFAANKVQLSRKGPKHKRDL